MCAQCQNRMAKTIQRGVFNNPKHWPPDWIASRLNIPLLGREPFVRPDWMPDEADEETNNLAQRLDAEEPEEDPGETRPEDYVPMYGEQMEAAAVYAEQDPDYYGDDFIGEDLTAPSRPAAPATPVAPAPAAPLYVREPDPAPVATLPAPESLPVFNSPQTRLDAAQEKVKQLTAQVFELEADVLHHSEGTPPARGSWLTRFLTWLTGVKRVRGAK